MSAICARCECEYSVRPDEDATRFCDECAHQLTEYLVGENEQLRAQVASLTAEVERKQAALESATEIIDAYAQAHPHWTYEGRTQDPMGAHKWLELFAARRAVLPVGGEG